MLIYKILKKILQWKKNKLLKNNFKIAPSIICNNCIGGIIYSDMKLKFNSPTINLFFFAPDYIKFVENLIFYFTQNLVFSFKSKYYQSDVKYPVGILHDIEIHFLHYSSFQECELNWYKRIGRIDYKNVFIIGSDRDFCTEEIRIRFAKLPFKNKVFFSSKPQNFSHEIFFDEYLHTESVGDLIADDKGWYFYFDVKYWFSTGKIRKRKLWKLLFKCFRNIKKINKTNIF